MRLSITPSFLSALVASVLVSAAAVHDVHEEDRKLKVTNRKLKSSKSKPTTRRPTTAAPTGRALPLPKLEARYGPLATDETIATYFRADGYQTVSSGIVNLPQISNSGAITQVLLPNELGPSQEEAERIAVTLCEQNPDCTAVRLLTEFPPNKKLINQNRAQYSILLANPAFGPIRLNKQGNEDAAVMADNYLSLQVKNEVTFLKKDKPGIKILEVCDVPIEEDLETAIGCVLGFPIDEATCDRLLTDDFDKYIMPAAECLSNGFTAPQNISPCLGCINNQGTGGDCDELPFAVCTEGVDKLSLFGEGGLCTDQCAEKCNAKVQTAVLCSAGTRRKLVPVFSSCVETLKGENTSNDLVGYGKLGECFVTGISGLNDYTCPGPDFELDLSVYDVGGDVFTDIYGQKIDYEVFEFPLPLAPHNCDCSRNGALSCLDCTLRPTLPPVDLDLELDLIPDSDLGLN